MVRPPAVVSIAGSDPSGGAGIQADLKTFGALGAYGMSVLTALTAQNTIGVQKVLPIDSEFVAAQLDSVTSDVRVDGVKIGVLGSAGVAEVIRPTLAHMRDRGVPIVLDPVLVATSGDRFGDASVTSVLRDLLPVVSVVTPNLSEAAALTATPVATDERGMRDQARSLLDLGVPAVLIKGGHLGGDAVDLWVDAHGFERFAAPRIRTSNTHGTGCSLSSALAALRPRRPDWHTTVTDAKVWLTDALRAADSLEIGAGHGPVHHFHRWW
ncbi:bifunctional hydroxymethylpyrimidine kinase/phosphomethylpyrimidine kinase [Yimella sp. NH-Cas1]|uniref:bifunctional hydroxymethylpyrimidine kinase/phosphomethylpyrimidine kinase n=1 Tax=Yimella sp. NH-Cas1 TaxID=2917726 RepID=UPI001EFBEF10|nr:bifunctional hydroxymethylpyrimidine kinase/phosphomethylpyrimidine kinase [Yimella sp. NH-Cas1]MCG8654858.1 bifunctional hydroxymethylpyrimidine kinase/phosphomethylpyrimidine kinase [Yimella sp. NH-Cas1]